MEEEQKSYSAENEECERLHDELKSAKELAEVYANELKDLDQHVRSFTGAGLNHAKVNGQIIVFIKGRPFYMSAKEAYTLYHAIGGVLDGLPERFFTDYGEGSSSLPIK